MDFLNKSFAQVADLFQSMTPGARVLAGLLLVVIVVSVAFLFQFQSNSGPDEYLFGGRALTSDDVDALLKIFGNDALDQHHVEGNRIRVPRRFMARYQKSLFTAGFQPTAPDTVLDAAHKGATPWEPRHLHDERLRAAKEKQLSLLISEMQGIERATVKIDVWDRHGLAGSRIATALATVKPDGNGHLDDTAIRAIRNAIAASNASLKPEDVSVLDVNAGMTYSGKGPDGLPPATEDPYFTRKLNYERHWTNELNQLLSFVPGVRVRVNVELDPQLGLQTTRITRDPKSIATRSVEQRKESTMRGAEQGGRPGTAPNGVGNQPVSLTSAAKGSESQTSEDRTEQESVTTAHEQTVKSVAALLPKQVRASVFVPNSYYEKVWKERNPAADGQAAKSDADKKVELTAIEQEIKTKIEKTIVPMLPALPIGEDRYPQVTVQSFQDLPTPAFAGPTVVERTSNWFGGHWQTLALVGLGLFSLLMLRSTVRAPAPTPADDQPSTIPFPGVVSETAAAEGAATEDEEADGSAASTLRKFQSTGPNLRLELTELVKADPEAAANVLRNWIGDAA